MRKWITFLLLAMLLILSIAVAGCSGQKYELDETAFALALGIDEAEDGQLEISYQIGAKAKAKGQSEEQSSVLKNEIITIRAATSGDSRNLINSIIAPSINMSHAKILVINEKLARSGLRDIVAPIVRFREYRGAMFIVISREPAKEFLKANSPRFTSNPAKYYEIMMKSSSQAGFFPKIQLHSFYLAMKDSSSQPYTVYAAINPSNGTGNAEKPVTGSKEQEYVAGSIPRSGGNSIEFAGTAIFRSDKMVGTLTTQETRALSLLSGHFPLYFLSVEDPLEPKSSIVVHVGLMEKPKIKAWVQDGRPMFDIDISLEGETLSIASGINYEQGDYRTLLEAQISNVHKEEINKFLRKTQKLNADIAGLGYYLRPQFNTVDEFNAYDWNDKYQLADIRVNVRTFLRRSGLMHKSAPIIVPSEE